MKKQEKTRRDLTLAHMDDIRCNVQRGIVNYKESLCKHLMGYYSGEIAVYIRTADKDARFPFPVHVHLDKEGHVSIEVDGDEYFVGEERLEIIIDELCAGRVYQNGKYSRRVGRLLAPLKRKGPAPFNYELLPF